MVIRPAVVNTKRANLISLMGHIIIGDGIQTERVII